MAAHLLGTTEIGSTIVKTEKPAYLLHQPLKQQVARDLGREYSQFLAHPEFDANEDIIDWFAESDGEVKPFYELSDLEQVHYVGRIDAILRSLRTLADKYLSSGDASQIAIGTALKSAAHEPAAEFRYMVGGQPVITFWGFEQSAPDYADLLQRYVELTNPPPVPEPEPVVPKPLEPEPEPSPVPVVQPKEVTIETAEPVKIEASPGPSRKINWSRLLIWLFWLLLIALLLWLLRTCVDEITRYSPVYTNELGEQAINCSDTSRSGKNNAASFTVSLGESYGSADFYYEMYSIKDRMIVTADGKTLLDTGCVSGNKTVELSIEKNSKVVVQVVPACEGGSTKWDFRLSCP